MCGCVTLTHIKELNKNKCAKLEAYYSWMDWLWNCALVSMLAVLAER